MNCLICDKDLYIGASLLNLLFDNDLICFKCRKSLCFSPKYIPINNYNVYSLYLYDRNFSSLLLQYKECYDEALCGVFLYPHIAKLKKKYLGYSIVLAPSSEDNINRRGFNHLYKIFESLKLPIIDCLYKDSNFNQNNLSLEERKNIIDHIHLKDISLPDKILLVDDVLTSGSTLVGCINCLKTKVKTIKVFTIAYNRRYLEL